MIRVKKTVEFCPKNLFSYITKSPTQKVAVSQLPLSVELEDEFDRYETDLIHMVPFSGLEVIPEVLAQHAEGCSSAEAFEKIKQRISVSSPSELCYYLYKKKAHVHS